MSPEVAQTEGPGYHRLENDQLKVGVINSVHSLSGTFNCTKTHKQHPSEKSVQPTGPGCEVGKTPGECVEQCADLYRTGQQCDAFYRSMSPSRCCYLQKMANFSGWHGRNETDLEGGFFECKLHKGHTSIGEGESNKKVDEGEAQLQ
eukprot:gnl/TRDRNA2_/TRDRNA2_169009_c0_seq2.p1 gnl/TRDRNA2_/TRDRNA2_169009_c0~~gnl/TRDRNA2_/TRDRNA2_169009_c0_seq2.p1  ORF type:complete len:154 (-),score=17.90 gnl/TRDRNA2_/TRDRNA2_169009_c0_seq2:106-546(-)